MQGAGVPGLSGDLLLLDLPNELLHQGLRDVPHSLRSTCRAFRGALDDSCHTLSLRHPAGSPRRLEDLTSLLRRLPQLRSLDNNHHDFKILPFLIACPTLQTRNLSGCSMNADQLQALSACPRLTSLNLSDCRPLLHIDFLSSLRALRALDLTNCNSLTSLAPLEHCTHLRALHVSRGLAGRIDLSPLTALPSLEALGVHNFQKSSEPHLLDLAPVAMCTAALYQARLFGNTVTTLGPLAACCRLQALHIDCTGAVTNLIPLAGCAASLTKLFFKGQGLASLAPLSASTALRTLVLVNVGLVTDLSPLAACTSLTTLLIVGCGATDVAPLAALGRTLVSLSLMRCYEVAANVTTPIAACTALTHLDLRDTPVETYLPLVACTRLEWLGCVEYSMPPQECAALLAACPLLVIQQE